MRLLSTERRAERYKIIYTWKVLQGLVPNCGVSAAPDSLRRVRLAAVPPLTGSNRAIRSLKEKSFHTEGPRLLNSLPRCLRDNVLTLPTFKYNLDLFLSELSDMPSGEAGQIPGPLNDIGQPSNSVRYWVRALSLSDWLLSSLTNHSKDDDRGTMMEE